jgi:two-component system nitrogen regulation response regulator GlnG
MADDSRGTVLVIDDDQDMRWAIRTILAETGLDIAEASAGAPGIEIAARCAPDAVLLDIQMPGIDGEEVLRRLKYLHKDLPVIVVTAHGTIPGAIEAIRTGAFEYITKPFRNDSLLDVVRRAVSRHRASSNGAAGARAATVRTAITSVMGHGAAIQSLADEIEVVIATDYSVLIRGETGAGKEVVARCLHERGPRAEHPLVVVDCGSIVDTLIDSELFGHERGAYTGAAARHCGWFEAAAKGGTLFLDEIGNLSPMGQKALLRALEERVIHRVGSTLPISIDTRVIAATNERLEDRVSGASFREDLFFRLAEYVIVVPPLRARYEDVEFLAGRFLDQARDGLVRPRIGISSAALDLLRSHAWPGNVRELRTVLRRAALVASDGVTAGQIAGCLNGSRSRPPPPIGTATGATPLRGRVRDKIREVERHAVIEALQRADGNKAQAARLLGIDYKTYRTKLKTMVDNNGAPERDPG